MTNLGKFLRMYRISVNMTLKEFAKRLNVSAAYVSAVELGQKPIPLNFADKIIQAFTLNTAQIKALYEAIDTSKSCFLIRTKQNPIDQKILGCLSRNLDSIEVRTKLRILSLLS